MSRQLPTLSDPSPSAMITVEELLEHTAGDEAIVGLLEALYIGNQRLLMPMLGMLRAGQITEYLGTVRAIWRVLSAMGRDSQTARLNEAVAGLQFHSIDFLRRQTAFIRTGDYQAEDAQAVYEEVYCSESVMREYLNGLLLTYIAWPNHYRLLQFYRNRYVSKGPPGRCLEIGPGHGFLALLHLEADSSNTLLGVDISPHSVAFTDELLTVAGIDRARFEICEGDATKDFAGVTERFDRIVIAEVIEHVEQPQRLLRSAVEHSYPETLLFLSTVVNIEAIDHLYLYRSLDEVREMIDECGLAIVDELDLPLEFADSPAESFEVALVCRPKPE